MERMEALMSLAPFLSGEAHIVELTLDAPVVRLSALDDGAARAANDTFDLGSVRVDEATMSMDALSAWLQMAACKFWSKA